MRWELNTSVAYISNVSKVCAHVVYCDMAAYSAFYGRYITLRFHEEGLHKSEKEYGK